MALHIEYLLRRNDCVILPGVGAFISVHIPARFDEEAACWYPMSQEIRFNQAVNQDDGLIANSYARKYSLPFHEARLLLDSDIRSMRDLIYSDGEVSIGRIGTLRRGVEGSLIFHPLYSQVHSGKEIGLIPVSSERKPKAALIKESESGCVTSLEKVKNVEEIGRKFDTNKNYYIAVNKVFAKVACSFIALCLIAALVILNTDIRLGEDKASVLPVKEIVDTTASLAKKATETSMKDDASADNEENEQKVGNSSRDTSVSTAESSEKRYHLIVGTFKTESDAKKFIATIQSEDKLETLPSKTLWRVSMASSDDKSELITILNSPDVSKKYEGAWIFEDKTAL